MIETTRNIRLYALNFGAADGSRTHLYGLGSRRSTDELRPQMSFYILSTLGSFVNRKIEKTVTENMARLTLYPYLIRTISPLTKFHIDSRKLSSSR